MHTNTSVCAHAPHPHARALSCALILYSWILLTPAKLKDVENIKGVFLFTYVLSYEIIISSELEYLLPEIMYKFMALHNHVIK